MSIYLSIWIGRSITRSSLLSVACKKSAELGVVAELCERGFFLEPGVERCSILGFLSCAAQGFESAFAITVKGSGGSQAAEGPDGIGVGGSSELKVVAGDANVF